MENGVLFDKYRTEFKKFFRHYREEEQCALLDSLKLALSDLKCLDTETDRVKADFIRIWSACIHHIEDEYENGMAEEDVRVCDNCGLPMSDGFYLAGEYACDEDCCLALYKGDKAQMEEDLSHAEEPEGECYWTEWFSCFYD